MRVPMPSNLSMSSYRDRYKYCRNCGTEMVFEYIHSPHRAYYGRQTGTFYDEFPWWLCPKDIFNDKGVHDRYDLTAGYDA